MVSRQLFGVLLGIAAFLWLRRLENGPVLAVRQNDEETDSQGGRTHTDGMDCWCGPVIFFDGGDEFGDVIVHKGNGEELPPARVLASAIADAISGSGEDKVFQ